jgi:hypothetical protein
MSEGVFYVRDVLGDLAAIRAILRHRAQRIEEAGGDPTVTMGHVEALDKLEHFLCGSCNPAKLRNLLANYEGQQVMSRAEVFKLMGED